MTWARVKRILHRMRVELTDDAITDSAAQLAYYFLFSVFPFLFFLVTLTAYFPLDEQFHALLHRAEHFLPDEARSLIEEHVHSLLDETRPRLLTFALVVAIWTASRAVDALRKALNLAFDVPETRPFWRTQAVALALTVVGSILALGAVGVFTLGGDFGRWLAQKYDVGHAYQAVLAVARFPATLLAIMLGASLMYWLLPNTPGRRYRLVSLGSVVASLLWVAVTWGFGRYVDEFASYNVTYGSIGGVMILLVWFYLCGLLLVLGGEVDSFLLKLKREKQGVPAEPALPVTVGAAKQVEAARRLRWRLWRRGLRTKPHPPADLPPDPRH